jgi:hypothetical protein
MARNNNSNKKQVSNTNKECKGDTSRNSNQGQKAAYTNNRGQKKEV